MFEELFCCHSWKSHAKRNIIKKIEYKDGSGIQKEFIREILICEKCGKIKKIDY